MSALYALSGYVAGTASTAAAYLLYNWFERSYREIEEREEITRILDLIGMEDELYVKFNASHLPYLRVLEELFENMPSAAADFVPAWAAILIIPPYEFLFNECCDDLVRFFRPDKYLKAVKKMSELKFDNLDIKNASCALNNYEKYADLLGDSVNAVSLYLSHPEFDSIMNKVIFRHDHCVSSVTEFIINKINLIMFKGIITQAAQISQLSEEDFNTLSIMCTLLTRMIDQYENKDNNFLKTLTAYEDKIRTRPRCEAGCTETWPDACSAVRAYQELPNHGLKCMVTYHVDNNKSLADQLLDLNRCRRIKIYQYITGPLTDDLPCDTPDDLPSITD
jgi:predicted transcriptional regulator